MERHHRRQWFNKIFQVSLLLAALFLYTPNTLAQVFEITCGPGLNSWQPLQTSDIITGKQKQNVCIDLFGNVFFQNTTLSSSAFNVKTFGASGDWQESDNGTVTATNIQTCTDCNFTQADKGKTLCGAKTFATQLPCTTIDVVNSSTSVHTVGAATGNIAGVTFAWGTPNVDAAINLALPLAIAASKGIANAGNLGVFSGAPQIYFPAGAYGICNTSVSVFNTIDGFSIIGDGNGQTRLIGLTGCSFGSAQALVTIGGAVTDSNIYGLTLDGMNGLQNFTFNSAALLAGSQMYVDRFRVQRFSSQGINIQGGIFANQLYSVANQANGIICQQCNGEFRNSVTSNNINAPNLIFQSVGGAPFGSGVRWYGGLIDECGSVSIGCAQVLNSYDVWFVGAALFATNGGFGLFVDGNSVAHVNGGVVGPFNVDSNAGGANIANGGTLSASDVKFYSTGTGHCIQNNGRFIDNGANKCALQQPISSTSEAVNTVTVNFTATCSVTAGQEINVLGVTPAGYNGTFFALTGCGGGTSFTYTDPTSGLGAGSGGFVAANGLSASGNAPLGISYLTNSHQTLGGGNPDITASSACAASTKTITFSTAYLNTPVIIVSDETTSGGARVSTKSATAFTVTCTGATDVFSYQVFGNPN